MAVELVHSLLRLHSSADRRMENLGTIGVSYATVDSPRDLAGAAGELRDSIPADAADLDRIVLIIPERVRKRLGWTNDSAPIVSIHLHDLVFSPRATADPVSEVPKIGGARRVCGTEWQ
jgi:hypothetical protein